jgi:hypothetical protein
MVDLVADEVNEDEMLPKLSPDEVNLGKYAVTKVKVHQIIVRRLLIHVAFTQLRKLSKKVRNSPTLRADLEAACVKSKIKPLQIVRDVATRWNSTALMLGRAMKLREAINLLVISEQHNKPRSARLKRFQLSKAEWDLLDKLFPLLEVSFQCLLLPCYLRSY